MKTLKYAIALAFLLCSGTFAVAQCDYSDYLDAAKRLLKEGSCDKAKSNYDVYVKLTGQTVSWLSSDINDCITRKSKPKTYNVGDDAEDFIGFGGCKIAYLDESGKHGFAIIYSEYTIITSSESDIPSIDELKIMYRNRYSLELSGEYWSSTTVSGIGSGLKYYTFDFSSGEMKRRKIFGDNYKAMHILRF